MSETPESRGLRKGFKDYFGGNLNVYSKILLPGDCSAVEEFIASDPVHGPTLKAAREAFKFGVLGGAAGGVVAGGWGWRLSKNNPKKTAMSFAIGAVCGFTAVAEVVGYWYHVQNVGEARYQHYKWSRKRAREES